MLSVRSVAHCGCRSYLIVFYLLFNHCDHGGNESMIYLVFITELLCNLLDIIILVDEYRFIFITQIDLNDGYRLCFVAETIIH